jgi:hypothetical protein
MNERIQLLAEQATSNISVVHEGYRGKGYTEQVEYFDKAKFAELIVRECANVGLETHGNYDVHDDILKHFGVEE